MEQAGLSLIWSQTPKTGFLVTRLISKPALLHATIYIICQLYEPRHDKINKVTVRPAKTQISLGIHPVSSESSLCAHWVAKDSSFLHADSEDSDQSGRMPRLIWVFAGRKVILLVLSRGGSYIKGTQEACLCNLVRSLWVFWLFDCWWNCKNIYKCTDRKKKLENWQF